MCPSCLIDCRLQKALRELNRQLDNPGAFEVSHIDRALGEIGRLLGTKVGGSKRQQCLVFRGCEIFLYFPVGSRSGLLLSAGWSCLPPAADAHHHCRPYHQ